MKDHPSTAQACQHEVNPPPPPSACFSIYLLGVLGSLSPPFIAGPRPLLVTLFIGWSSRGVLDII